MLLYPLKSVPEGMRPRMVDEVQLGLALIILFTIVLGACLVAFTDPYTWGCAPHSHPGIILYGYRTDNKKTHPGRVRPLATLTYRVAIL